MNIPAKTKIIINFGVIIAAMLFAFNPVLAQSGGNIADIVFENEPAPLFGETDILPGDSVTKWVRVNNLVNDTLAITTDDASYDNDDGLGDQLNLTIKKGAVVFYNGSMSAFFAAGAVNLGTLAAYEIGQYDYTVSFKSDTGNSFQNKSLSFDISVSAQVTESIGGENPAPDGGGGGGGGGYVIGDLIITDINAALINNSTDASITVTWLTNKNATSRVIYDTVPHPDLTGELPPNYGYAYSTVQDPAKVTGHSVTINGLLLGTTYYLRPLSAASPEKFGGEISVTPGADGNVKVEIAQAPTPPTPRQAVLGEKITETSDGNSLSETGFDNVEFIFLIGLMLVLFILSFILRRREAKHDDQSTG